jgi:hypothetical protein
MIYMLEEHKAIFKQVLDGMDANDVAIIDRLLDPNFVDHDLPSVRLRDHKG